ncbi:TetR/AcrR family transcriptional regulator [Kitasatospora aureofaciens]|uniref:TetR/AcrR family transcriptional regulator n=1 Tax=Kitasatospora aureofaciens TaxID=1894 RepID=UPI001C472EF0|nr:TetR/AcrR family transcriptional regulator [Kitasatospora aureofaciens]MBV6699638.1 TetR/AcrR family transcriptional regulator [Kitasatospora aureofaciens]
MTSQPPRPTLIADAAIALIAERGLRGLTHRAVDEAAGLPTGSTSNLARTRAALLELALTRIAELESAGFLDPALMPGSPRELLAQVAADGLHQALTSGRTLTVARIELALEAARRPELRDVYDRLGARFLDVAALLLARCGSPEPAADARRLIRWCDGVLFNATAGSGHGHPPTSAELQDDVARYLTALLARPE